MKKLLALILAVTFVLMATPAVFAAYTPGQDIPTEETVNNHSVSKLKWKAGFAADKYGYDPAIAGDFFVAGDVEGYIWNTHATYLTDTSADGSVISAKLSPKTSVGIFFGATNAIVNCTNLKQSSSAGVKYYEALIKFDNGSYSLTLYNDSSDSNDSKPTMGTVEASVELDKTVYGINDTSDITLKVDFDKDGNVKAYVNGVEAISKTGLVPYGNKCGIMFSSQRYDDRANAVAATVSDFVVTSKSKWKGGPVSDNYRYAADKVSVLGSGDEGYIWNSLATYLTDTNANGSIISAKFSPKVTGGIFFGATDAILNCTKFDETKSAGVMYYEALIKYVDGVYTLVLARDNSGTDNSRPDHTADNASVASVELNKTKYGINDTSDITLKVDFDKNGNVKVYVNGIEAISKTELVPFGNKCGVVFPMQKYGAEYKDEVVATVSDFTIGSRAASETGDAAAVYVVVSALVLCTAFAVISVSRKKRIAE